MSAWTGAEGTKPHECPKVMFVERKPEPLGCEMEDAADAQCGAIFRLEINEGKEKMAAKKYVSEYGATTSCSLRLSEKLRGSKRCWGGRHLVYGRLLCRDAARVWSVRLR